MQITIGKTTKTTETVEVPSIPYFTKEYGCYYCIMEKEMMQVNEKGSFLFRFKDEYTHSLLKGAINGVPITEAEFDAELLRVQKMQRGIYKQEEETV